MNQFEGLNVVVTGGTGALGRAVVAAIAEQGGSCYIPTRRPERRDRPGLHYLCGTDLTDGPSVKRFYQKLPPLSASIHCAGGFTLSPLLDTSTKVFQKMLELNLTTCFLCCREAIRNMQAHSLSGRIVNVAARPALEPRSGAFMASYTAAKAGVAALTQALAEEFARERIWINAVAPSLFDSPANRRAMPEADHSLWPSSEAVAATICFLASPQNDSSRGAVVPVYGAA